MSLGDEQAHPLPYEECQMCHGSKIKNETEINQSRTLEILIPNFLAHQAQTPNERISKKKTIF